jgi:acyl transferase domain-containing protein
VLGHSAGEVPAAYAAGLLSLEEAVAVVYHRSSEQQKLAGSGNGVNSRVEANALDDESDRLLLCDGLSGRMLAVGMSEASAKELLSGRLSQTTASVEIACINSPNSVVLAGPAVELEAVSDLLPPGMRSSLVPGNIAFHCSLTQPIVDKLAKRLQPVLSRRKGISRANGSAPFISTVSGRVHKGPLDAAYWVDNVRQPVRFQQVCGSSRRRDSPLCRLFARIGCHVLCAYLWRLQAVETLCQMDPLPGLVLEIGPHRTLVGPLLQTVRGLGLQVRDYPRVFVKIAMRNCSARRSSFL